MSDVHVMPVNDIVEHVNDADESCVCGPTTEAVERDDGSFGYVVIHHALDGRQ